MAEGEEEGALLDDAYESEVFLEFVVTFKVNHGFGHRCGNSVAEWNVGGGGIRCVVTSFGGCTGVETQLGNVSAEGIKSRST